MQVDRRRDDGDLSQRHRDNRYRPRSVHADTSLKEIGGPQRGVPVNRYPDQTMGNDTTILYKS
jgi:hypothetical protein